MLPRRLLLILVLNLTAGPAFAAGLRDEVLEVGEGEVRAVRARDMTGDGLDEIVAFADGPGGISISVFLAGEKGYPRKPTAVLVPKDRGLGEVYFTFLANLRSGDGAEIVTVDRKGVFAHALTPAKKGEAESWTLSEPRRIGDSPALPFFPDEERITVLDAAADLDGDGVEELLLPSAEGYRILRATESGADTVDTGTGHFLKVFSHRYFTLTWEFPRLTVADWDRDGIKDLIAGFDGRLLLYLQRRDGTFFEASRPLSILEPGPEDRERTTLTLGDVDRDGMVDLLVTQSPATVKVFEQFTSQQSLFLNPRIFSPKTKGKLATPAVTWKTDGISVNPDLTDFDGDGDLDLLVTSLGLDLGSRIRKEVKAEYMLFLFDKKKRVFERKPHFKVSRTFPVKQLERNSTDPVCFFAGDFNADGERDLLDIADNGHITILRGTSDTGFLSPDPYAFKEELFKRKASVANDVLIRDLNGDGASDVVAYRKNRVFVIRSVR